mgnify:CR=1 FL=1
MAGRRGWGRLTLVATAHDLSDAGVSAREAEVLAALGEHLTNAEIAQRLHISVRTVESHVSSLLRTLGAAGVLLAAAGAGVLLALVPGLIGHCKSPVVPREAGALLMRWKGGISVPRRSIAAMSFRLPT